MLLAFVAVFCHHSQSPRARHFKTIDVILPIWNGENRGVSNKLQEFRQQQIYRPFEWAGRWKEKENRKWCKFIWRYQLSVKIGTFDSYKVVQVDHMLHLPYTVLFENCWVGSGWKLVFQEKVADWWVSNRLKPIKSIFADYGICCCGSVWSHFTQVRLQIGRILIFLQ